MPVHWDVSKIKNHEIVTTHPKDPNRWHPLTDALVNACSAVGLTDISEKNFEEWLWRLAFMEAVGEGGMLFDWFDDKGNQLDKPRERNYTRAEIESHIGLRTNWGTLTRQQWLSNYLRNIKGKADRIYRKKFAAPEVAKAG
jgi:hypothetical protein